MKRNFADILLTLGYYSYGQYLASDQWATIRNAVLVRDEHRCLICHAPANQVHHHSYAAAVMEGKRFSSLSSLCRHCHQKIEIRSNGKKRRLAAANKAFRRRQHAYRQMSDAEKWTPIVPSSD